jgi:DNA-binding transcriptional regulator LsrR (DeoR family)
MSTRGTDFENMRLMARVLTLHYQESYPQSQIASQLGLSTAKVNRLIKQGRESGMLEITVNSPFQREFELESKLSRKWDLKYCLVVSSVSGNAKSTLNQVGKGAGDLLVGTIRDGDTIAISGGKALSAVIDNLNISRSYDVNVVPMTGGVQGQHYTDVNYIATQLAEKLGGRATVLHAPLHADSKQERDMLMSVRATRDVMDMARNAAVALVGVGSVIGDSSTYYDAHPVSEADRKTLVAEGVRAELIGHLIDGHGNLSDNDFNSRLVGLSPHEAAKIPTTIGVASGPEKVRPVCAALNGGFINSLVLDEHTVEDVLEYELKEAVVVDEETTIGG